MEASLEKNTIYGRHSYVPLDRMEPFFLAWEQDPWGRLRPPLSLDVMRLSLELAASAYDLDVDRWLEAGWTDVSIQVDNHVRSGISKTPLSDTKRFIRNTWALYRSKLELKQRNPISQVRGAMRQKEQSDTGKVLVMIRPAPNGRYVVAIGFMGTGSRFYDWFSNFRFTSEGGLHQGFSQLARQFERNEELIQFPQTARELGLESLNLAQIVQEAVSPNSRFLLWMAGHSQGGALMQVWGHFKLRENGVLPKNMLGCGFASPSVAAGTALPDPAAYPFYHILNSDDFVPRMGAQVHLGVCLIYPGDEKLRRHCYAWRQTEEAAAHRALVRRMLRRMVDTPACMESGMAYVRLIFHQPVQDLQAAYSGIALRILPIKQLLYAADAREKDLLRFLERHVNAAYQSITGRPMEEELLATLESEMQKVVDQIGLGSLNRALMELMLPPHHLTSRQGAQMGAYTFIALRGVPELHPAIWQSGQPPVRLWYLPREESALTSGGYALALTNRRLPPPKRREPKHKHHGYTRARR